MTSDIQQRLARLQRQAGLLMDLAAGMAAAAPHDVEGWDPTGSVRVVVAGDGTPRTIYVIDGWRQRLEPARLGDAVLEANAAAVREGMRIWSERLDESSWWARRAQADDSDGGSSLRDEDSIPPSPGRERDATQLTEAILGALQAVRARDPEALTVGKGHGSDASGHVTLTLGEAGIVACTVDTDWAARTGDGGVGAALVQALLVAKTAAEGSGLQPDLDGLAADALATLQAITKSVTPGGRTTA